MWEVSANFYLAYKYMSVYHVFMSQVKEGGSFAQVNLPHPLKWKKVLQVGNFV